MYISCTYQPLIMQPSYIYIYTVMVWITVSVNTRSGSLTVACVCKAGLHFACSTGCWSNATDQCLRNFRPEWWPVGLRCPSRADPYAIIGPLFSMLCVKFDSLWADVEKVGLSKQLHFAISTNAPSLVALFKRHRLVLLSWLGLCLPDIAGTGSKPLQQQSHPGQSDMNHDGNPGLLNSAFCKSLMNPFESMAIKVPAICEHLISGGWITTLCSFFADLIFTMRSNAPHKGWLRFLFFRREQPRIHQDEHQIKAPLSMCMLRQDCLCMPWFDFLFRTYCSQWLADERQIEQDCPRQPKYLPYTV